MLSATANLSRRNFFQAVAVAATKDTNLSMKLPHSAAFESLQGKTTQGPTFAFLQTMELSCEGIATASERLGADLVEIIPRTLRWEDGSIEEVRGLVEILCEGNVVTKPLLNYLARAWRYREPLETANVELGSGTIIHRYMQIQSNAWIEQAEVVVATAGIGMSAGWLSGRDEILMVRNLNKVLYQVRSLEIAERHFYLSDIVDPIHSLVKSNNALRLRVEWRLQEIGERRDRAVKETLHGSPEFDALQAVFNIEGCYDPLDPVQFVHLYRIERSGAQSRVIFDSSVIRLKLGQNFTYWLETSVTRALAPLPRKEREYALARIKSVINSVMDLTDRALGLKPSAPLFGLPYEADSPIGKRTDEQMILLKIEDGEAIAKNTSLLHSGSLPSCGWRERFREE